MLCEPSRRRGGGHAVIRPSRDEPLLILLSPEASRALGPQEVLVYAVQVTNRKQHHESQANSLTGM